MAFTHTERPIPPPLRPQGLLVSFDNGQHHWPVLAVGHGTFVVSGTPIAVDTTVRVTFVLSALLSVTVTARAHGTVEQVAQIFSVDSEFAEVAALLELAAADDVATIH